MPMGAREEQQPLSEIVKYFWIFLRLYFQDIVLQERHPATRKNLQLPKEETKGKGKIEVNYGESAKSSVILSV